VFALPRLPEGSWRLTAHYVPARERPLMHETVSISYIRVDAREHIQLHQTGPREETELWPRDAEPDSVERDGTRYQVLRGSGSQFGQPSIVVFTREGTRITLSSSEVDPEALLELATSLEAV
jgi:hypothetical protein